MPYSTPAAVRTAVASPENPDNPPATPTHTAADLDNATLIDAIAEADATIDEYLSGTYVTPVPNDETSNAVPHPVDYWSRNIAAYLATLTFRKSKDLTDNDPIVRRYTATMQALTAIRDGKAFVKLTEIDSGVDTGVVGAGPAVNPYSGNLFGADDFDLVPDFGTPAGPGFVANGTYYSGWPS